MIDPISAAMLAITVASEGAKYAGAKKDKKRQRQLDAEEAASVARIEAEIANADVPTAGDQQATAALNRRIANRREQTQAAIGRDNIAGSPAAEARLREMDTEGMRSSDALVGRLAEMRDARRLRAIYALPEHKARAALKAREDVNPNAEILDTISRGAAHEFSNPDSVFRKMFTPSKMGPQPLAPLPPKAAAVMPLMARPALPSARPAGDVKAGSGMGMMPPPEKVRPAVSSTALLDALTGSKKRARK